MLRHLLRKAARYRVRTLIRLLLDNFELLLPTIREVIIYLRAVINDVIVEKYKTQFETIVHAHYMRLPFVNLWISHLLSHPSFSKINLPETYDTISTTRFRTLIAIRKKDTTWVRSFRDNVDTLGPLDKRAVLYSSSILPLDEMRPWLNSVTSNGDIVEQSIAHYLISKKKSVK